MTAAMQILQELVEIDTDLLLAINGMHSPFWDSFMNDFSGKLIWVPMYAAILYVVWKNFSWKVAILSVVAVALTITFADQVCSSLIRPAVERLRPSNLASPIADLVHIVDGHRGGTLRISVLPCGQHVGIGTVPPPVVAQQMAEPVHGSMGIGDVLLAGIFGVALSRRSAGWRLGWYGWRGIDVWPAGSVRRIQASKSRKMPHIPHRGGRIAGGWNDGCRGYKPLACVEQMSESSLT